MVTELKPLQFGMAVGILHGAYLFLLGLIAAFTGYGTIGVTTIGSIVYGYAPTFLGSIWGLVCGLIGGFIGGFLLAWLYNLLLGAIK
jgi:hypothetical protein